ncbi:MAG: helicase-related protein [Isosphaeraceae bacterium]
MNEILPGTEVVARGLRWEVVSTESLGQETLFRLRGLERAVLGRELDLLSPFEEIEPVQHELRPERAAPLINWLVYHQAFLLEQALGPSALLAVQPGRLRIEPYQLVPVLRAIRSSRVRLLLADAVGLGKTIQAGLVITELVARRLAHRVLIVTPPGPLLEQWHLEMAERFGLRLEVIDRSKLEEIRRSTELGSNPFDFIPLGLVSIDFLKQERILDQLDRASYDIIIVDEAHHCTDTGSIQDAEDSQRRGLAEVLARRCDSLLLLTATPHDGYDRSFASLCELLDPSLVDGRGSLRGERYRTHVIRRLKRHIIDPQTGKQQFKDRIVEPTPVVPDPKRYGAFVELQRSLLDLVAPELRRAFRSKRYADVLAFIALLKRSVSTVAALRSTLQVVAERFQHIITETAEAQESRRQRIKTLRDYQRKLDRFGVLSALEEQERNLLEAEDLAQQLANLQRETKSGSRQLSKVSDIVARLDELINLAETCLHRDPKIDRVKEVISEIRKAEPRANILIYTEYVDSQNALAEALHNAPEIGQVATMSGLDGEKARAAVTERFRSRDNLILVSTDSAAEGLNLHQRCHHLIHLELPFNPNRLEQRNGRIDRYGQRLDPVVRYLFLRGTFEDRILLRLIAKYERMRSRLTFVPNTLGLSSSTDAGQERLLKGIMDDDTKLFKEDSSLFDFKSEEEPPVTDLATKELLEEIDRSLKGFEQAAKTNVWLGDAGLNAEAKLVEEATEAQKQGNRAESVDLARFVVDAVLLDGGDLVEGAVGKAVFTLRVPPAWTYGLDRLPGYDSVKRLIRLTADIEITTDPKGDEVGYLGRAHPLVRRALDRVRNLSYGGMSTANQDPRTSAARANVPEPTLLFTFLGKVSSRKGRELEQVLAVKVSRDRSAHPMLAASEWHALADPSWAIRTTGIWEEHFADWYNGALSDARKSAFAGFSPLAREFTDDRKAVLKSERHAQSEWLKKRAEEISGPVVSNQSRQGELFGSDDDNRASDMPAAEWGSITDPSERLAAFASDRSQRPAQRSEADGVLRIFQQRASALDMLMDIRPPEVILLGVLMLVPEVSRGA